MKLRKRSQVAEMSADELHRAMVEDFVNHIYPDTLHGLGTQIMAVRKIADEKGMKVDDAFRAILEEAQALGADGPSAFSGHLQ